MTAARHLHGFSCFAASSSPPAAGVLRSTEHIPAPRLHLVRYYGHYAHVPRGRRRRARGDVRSEGRAGPGVATTDAGPLEDEPSPAERRRRRRQWAQLIRRIYEADPLLCTCGAPMRILSFLTEPPVIHKILEHLESAGSDAARAPPPCELEPRALAS